MVQTFTFLSVKKPLVLQSFDDFYDNEDENGYLIWDIFVDLEDKLVIDIVEKALDNVYIFRYKNLQEAMVRASKNPLFNNIKSYKTFADMLITDILDRDFVSIEDSEWCSLDLNTNRFESDKYANLEMLQKYEDTLVNKISNNPELIKIIQDNLRRQ